MFPVARLGDPITHDFVTPCGVVGPCPTGPAPTVIIEGQPAATAGCVVVCSGVIAVGLAHPPPPSAGVIVSTSTVLIDGKPAARWSPSPDVGSCGVAIGNPALYATRTVLVG